LPGVLEGSGRKRRLLQGKHDLAVTDLHAPVASDQHDEQFTAAAVALKDPSGQDRHTVDSLLEAKVPCRHFMHEVEPAQNEYFHWFRN
jgi:hypothetical protein